ncbi:hypothetical protein BN7_1860 [Wickerhamomyces ciferrii]|uniref:Cell morphogenesis protein n=1 Tax=Wickerhamomyces ciferrii (strain ATCC 14091 / BCRC 22168 / CBS 111 / JCM 3599 / NBRC 0793 / NRRL Y-1031 F-60-10) TaxID=1206466 RepID=K0KH57_WICCF|nr:uncharacterized protein BN7_1860 [Wickerhamomyces ciferrii]CCH42316.1 hypothetical protein BN7_1860 [Wickerhamomyces ciferrii]
MGSNFEIDLDRALIPDYEPKIISDQGESQQYQQQQFNDDEFQFDNYQASHEIDESPFLIQNPQFGQINSNSTHAISNTVTTNTTTANQNDGTLNTDNNTTLIQSSAPATPPKQQLPRETIQQRRLTSNNTTIDEINTIRKSLATDSKTPTEYTLHILFTQFVRHAERKLNVCLTYPLNTEPPIMDLLAEGIDPNFDKIIASLGYISKNNPKPVIDSVMFWRKSKSEVAAMAADAAEKSLIQLKEHKESSNFRKHTHSSSSVSKFSHKRNNSSKSTVNVIDSRLGYLEQQVQQSRDTAIQGDRKSLISIYILCRVLIEVVKQLNPSATGDDLGDKLEEIVFTQLRSTDPILISSSIIRSANWNLFAELLGYMSDKRFLSVSDRFIADLEKIPAVVPKEIEPSIHLLIHGMRYLKLKNYPLEDFEESADFIQSIAKFFSITKSHSIKIAYSQVLTHILLPLADTLTAEVNHPTWSEAINTIYKTCETIELNPKSWLTNLTLITSVLCVAPSELFLSQWYDLVESNIRNLKSKHATLEEKIIIVTCISRLIWVYIFRCTETLNNTTRKIETIFKNMFLGKNKQTWMISDASLILPCVQMFRAIGFAGYNQTVENFIIPLIKATFNGHSLDSIQHERVILAIKAYTSMLGDKERPAFPEDTDIVSHPDVDIDIKSSNHDEIGKYVDALLILLDSSVGASIEQQNDQQQQQQPSTPFYYSAKSPFSSFRFGSDMSIQLSKSLHSELFAVVLECVPWCAPGPSRKIIELLCRNSLHSDFRVSSAASNSLKIMASRKNPNGLITSFAKFAFNFTERSGYSQSYIISKELLRLYLDLLECWLKSLQSKNEDEEGLNDENSDNKIVDELQWKNTITVIEEVEGHGLFFLSSQDFEIRKLGLNILRITENFDQALYDQTQTRAKQPTKGNHNRSNSKFAADIGTRVIFILQTTDFFKLIGSHKQYLSVAERSRLSKLSQKQRRDVLLRLAESDYGIDSALWFRVFPKLLSICFERCPMTMALTRSIVCTRLVQIHESILNISETPRSNQKSNYGPPEVLIEQWKLYLIVACTSLTSTSEQRLHIPANYSHGKKKLQQLLTIQHSTITSARSVFKLTLNLLNGYNQAVRDAIITGLSCMNINIFRTFIECVEPIFTQWEQELGKQVHSKDSRLRVEVTHVLNIVSRFIEEESISQDEWIVDKLVGFIKVIKSFLSQYEVQHSFEFQKLRRYFCGLLENVYNGIQKNGDASKWLPFEARVACFTYLEEWCGYGKYSSIAKQRYAQMTKHVTNSQELAALNSAIEFERQILSIAATNSMVALLNGKIHELRGQTMLKFDLPGLLSWIDLLFGSPNERISSLAKKALRSLFKFNSPDPELYREVMKKCVFDQILPTIENYYVVLVEALLENESYPIKNHEVLLLGLYGCSSNSFEIRSTAIKLLINAEKKLFGSDVVNAFSERVMNNNKTIYKRAALDVSTYFASSHPEQNIFLISELTMYFQLINSEARRDLLAILMPWLQTVELKITDDGIDIESYMVLSNLFEITIKFSDAMPTEIEALWISLGNGANLANIDSILKFSIKATLLKRNPLFVEFASKVLVYLSASSLKLTDTLVSYIEPKAMVPPQLSNGELPTNEIGLPYIANIWKTLNYTGKDSVFSLGQLSLIYLADLIVVPKDTLTAKIPLLLHTSFVLLDHYLPIVQESAAKMIIYVLGTVGPHPKLEETKDIIRRNHKSLWIYDDLNHDKNGARSPKDMDLLVRNILEIFNASAPNLQQDWGRVALSWATTCAVRHIACRSFQVFRSLLSFLDQSMLKDMLHRLSNTISDETHDIQGFAMQILMTLNAIVSELDAEKLIDYPQIFWVTVASLNTINEHEYVELLSVLNKFLSKIDLDSEDTVACLFSTFPPNWEGKFEGLQQIIMIGLRSSVSLEASLQLLDKLNKLSDSEIIAGESRLLFALLTNIPRYSNALEKGDITPQIQESTNTLREMAMKNNQPNLARIIDSLSKNRFRTKSDFLSQTVNFIAENYLAEYSGQTVIFLLGLLSNKTEWVKIETMKLLKLLFPKINLAEPQFQGCGADLISPLLRLLLTPYAQQALEVLDETTSISGSKLDKDILRMSLGNKTIRKDYEKTATLFGIPEESGWSIPMPAVTAATTRNNVHAVFTTCRTVVESEIPEEEVEQQEQIKFHREDYNYGQSNNEAQDAASITEENDGSLSHMWAELDNLDSFFTKDAENSSNFSDNTNGAGHHFRSTSIDTRFSTTDQLAPFESAPQVYDKKVSVILNRSLARTQSNTSFKTSLADSFGNSPMSDTRHLSGISSREAFLRSRGELVSSSENSGSSTPTSPTFPKEDSFRFEGLLAQPAQPKPRKRLSRFSQPDYIMKMR